MVAHDEKLIIRVCSKCSLPFAYTALASIADVPECVRQKCAYCGGRGRWSARTCKQCGDRFTYERQGGRKRHYCSDECRREWEKKRDMAVRQRAASQSDQQCSECGKLFAGRKCKRCPACRDARLVNGVLLTCDDCDSPFRARTVTAKRCKDCRRIAEAKRRRKSERPRIGIQGSQQSGAIAEQWFDLLCAKMGWLVAAPVFDTNPGWDRIVVSGKSMWRVQVKGRDSEKISEGAQWKLDRVLSPITEERCDIVAVVDTCKGDIWLVTPSEACDGFHPGATDPVNWGNGAILIDCFG